MQLTTQDPSLELMPASALEAQERAQIDVQITTAKRYPRTLSTVKKSMLEFATLDEETAASCFYTLPRKSQDGGNKNIQGPGVRLAEIALSCFGNIRAAARIISNDGKAVTAQGVCHDLQNNVSVSVEVKRRITDKNGRTYSDDMQIVTGNAACAIALRNAVFKVVPGALVHPVYEAAKKCAVGDATTLAARRHKCVDAFGKMGVPKDKLLAKLAKKAVEDITLDDLELLLGLHTSIKDGNTTIDEAFNETPTSAMPVINVAHKSDKALEEEIVEFVDRKNAEVTEAKAKTKAKAKTEPTPREILALKAEDAGFPPAQVVEAARQMQFATIEANTMADLSDDTIDELLRSFDVVLLPTMQKLFPK